MSFFKITDPYKRNELMRVFIAAKKKLKVTFMAERLGEIGFEQDLMKQYKPLLDSQTVIQDTLSKELKPIAESTATTLRAIQGIPDQFNAITYPFATYPTTDESPKPPVTTLGLIAQKYLKGGFSKKINQIKHLEFLKKMKSLVLVIKN